MEETIAAIRGLADRVVAAEPARIKSPGWWRRPVLVASAPVDGRFEALPRIAAEDHLHPRDLLPGARSVVVFFLPFVKTLARANAEGAVPTRDWGVAYVETNTLIGRVSEAIAELLARRGARCGLTPATHNFDEARLTARWSHKHLGHLAGLGRFGAHHLLITPAGCAGRLGSLVTDAELGEHPVIETAEACLMRAGKECGRCMTACPVQALKAQGFERRACWERLKANRAELAYFQDLPPTTHVCGKCAAAMPCSFANPVARIRAALTAP